MFLTQLALPTTWTAENPVIDLTSFISDLARCQTENLLIVLAGWSALTIILGGLLFNEPLSSLLLSMANKETQKKVINNAVNA